MDPILAFAKNLGALVSFWVDLNSNMPVSDLVNVYDIKFYAGK